MKLKAALLMVLVIFAATATTFFAFKVSNIQRNGMAVIDSVEHHHVLQIGNQTICQIPIDTPGGPG